MSHELPALAPRRQDCAARAEKLGKPDRPQSSGLTSVSLLETSVNWERSHGRVALGTFRQAFTTLPCLASKVGASIDTKLPPIILTSLFFLTTDLIHSYHLARDRDLSGVQE